MLIGFQTLLKKIVLEVVWHFPMLSIHLNFTSRGIVIFMCVVLLLPQLNGRNF